MRKIYILLLMVFIAHQLPAQLPHRMTESEKAAMPAYLLSRTASPGAIAIPPASPVRTIGEWEELQGLVIAWTSYQTMLRNIVAAAKLETRVYILCANPATVQTYLANYGIDTVNVTFLQAPFNSVWSRDYGPWSAYTNDVDTLLTVDWIYNRPRPLDDAVPSVIAAELGTPFYETTTAPWNLVHTGGNFMTDGFGTGYSSKLILHENPNKTEAEIDTIMNRFMGISRYIKMDTLDYDVIHHIDMHMKLLDEETILMGEYPAGVSDGPAIEANLQYVLANFMSVYGTPYKVIRIPMPPDNGQYPSNGGDYLTYTNSSFINKTIIVPTYGIPQDTTALRIYNEALPGYTVVGINSSSSIGSLGALHCITKELGTDDPLLISHQPLPDTYDDVNPYLVIAYMKHRTGIANATLYYRTDSLLPYTSIAMVPMAMPDRYMADIPAQVVGTTIQYYVTAEAVSGKSQARPLPAPVAYWDFRVLGTIGIGVINTEPTKLQLPFPNPSKGITCIPISFEKDASIILEVFDMQGRKVKTIFSGDVQQGERKFFINAATLPQGIYSIRLFTGDITQSTRLMVK